LKATQLSNIACHLFLFLLSKRNYTYPTNYHPICNVPKLQKVAI